MATSELIRLIHDPHLGHLAVQSFRFLYSFQVHVIFPEARHSRLVVRKAAFLRQDDQVSLHLRGVDLDEKLLGGVEVGHDAVLAEGVGSHLVVVPGEGVGAVLTRARNGQDGSGGAGTPVVGDGAGELLECLTADF